MERQHVLVTGGAGNIGSALVRALIQETDHRVVILDNLSTGAWHKLPHDLPKDRWTFIKGDANRLEDLTPLFAHYEFASVFHLAAVVGVRRTLDNPLLVLQDIDGIRHLLHLSKSCAVQRFFYASSSEVYGEPVETPQSEETTPLNSRLPYAVVKNVGEVYLKAYLREHRLPYTILRFFNTYGPMQSTDFVISKFIDKALSGEPLVIYGDGLQTRTFSYVTDSVGAVVAMLGGSKFVNETVNIGSDEEITILDLAKLTIRVLDSRSQIVHAPALDEGDMRRRLPDVEKMASLLGRRRISLEDGIALTAQAFRTGK